MTTPFPFTSGQTLTAAQLNAITTLPINDQTASYTLVVGDAGKRVVMNVATANTVTVNDSVFTTGDTIFVANKGLGASTLTAGAGVTINTAGSLVIAQHGGGTLVATSASVFTFFSGGALANPSTLEFLCIAGGGGGALAGGGAGGYRNSVVGEDSGGGAVAESPFAVSSGVTYTITVGNGGASQTNGSNSSIAGSNITTITSTGGGRGGLFSATGALQNGGSGGSGGGAGNANPSLVSGSVGAGTANQGFAGGLAVNGSTAAGGGGGSDAVGSAGVSSTGGNGGAGNSSSITGTSVGRAGGGGGGNGGTGTQGGGNGAVTPTAGAVNTGGGGGGRNDADNAGAAGGKGVVIIRQLVSQKFPTTLTGAITTVTATHTIFTFNDSGTLAYS